MATIVNYTCKSFIKLTPDLKKMIDLKVHGNLKRQPCIVLGMILLNFLWTSNTL